DRLAAAGKEKQHRSSDAGKGLRVELRGIMRAGERLAAPLSHGNRSRGAGGDAHALPSGGEISLLLPAAIALDLVARVEGVALQKAIGEAQRHGGVVAPRTAR